MFFYLCSSLNRFLGLPFEITTMESSKGSGDHPKAADVISKLKYDGDFDDLRLKIIRKINENVSPLQK